MPKQIIGRENAVEALAALCRDYRGTAFRAIRQGKGAVLIPADSKDLGMLEALARPEGLIQFRASNEADREPCYANYEEFIQGRNTDGSLHAGYLEVDVVAKLVTDFCDRGGKSVVPAPTIKPFNPQAAFNELRYGKSSDKESYCL